MSTKDEKQKTVVKYAEQNRMIFSAYNEKSSFLIVSHLQNHSLLLDHLFDLKYTVETLELSTWEYFLDNPTSNISCFIVDEESLNTFITDFLLKS